MIPPNIMFFVVIFPIIAIIGFVYFFFFWLLPSEFFCLGYNKTITDWVKGALYSHALLLFIIWLTFAVYWVAEGEGKYNQEYKNYVESVK